MRMSTRRRYLIFAAANGYPHGKCGDNAKWKLINGVLTIYGTGETYSYSAGHLAWEEYKTQITRCVIESGITKLNNSLFSGCTTMTSVTIPGSVTTIGIRAFENCRGLTGISVPSSVTSVGQYAFNNCSGLQRVDISDLTAWMSTNFSGYAGTNPLEYAHHLYVNGTEVTSITIPEGATSVGIAVLSGAAYITSVSLPSSLRSIGALAFAGLSSLSQITLPDGLTSLGQGCFSNSGLTSITIPAGVTAIPNTAFSFCWELVTATLHDGITTFGNQAFYNAVLLQIAALPASTTSLGTSAFNNTKAAFTDIPAGVTTIGRFALAGSQITTLTFHGTPNSIAADALGANVTTINVPWAEGAVANAPWGATNATIHYNS